MARGLGRCTWVMLLVALVFASNAPAFAQGGSNATTLSGLVVGSDGRRAARRDGRSQGKRHRGGVHGGV